MCAIAGWLDPAGTTPDVALTRMAEAMTHRGPDDRGFHRVPDRGLALAHNRLSIIDLSSAGHQPMISEDGQVALVFNGEAYNFQELRAQLTTAGHRFRSRTDSEVILQGYRQWGLGVLERLRGMFAFGIWDEKEDQLVLARDPMGIKPLYYWQSDTGGLYFASEIKAFLVLPGFQAAVNPRTLRQYLEFNFVTDPEQSSLLGVRKVPAGHSLVFRRADALARSSPRCRRFYRPPDVVPASTEDAAARADRLYEVLDEVVGQHLVADVPVGLLLSGGIDSSVVAALAARRGRIRTICMAFSDSAVDERPFARVVSRHLGSDHEEVVISSETVADDLSHSAWYIDDLFGDWGLISTMMLYRRCRDAGVKVVLVGEGSDELFGGYPQFAFAGGAAHGLGLWSRALRLYRWYSGRRWGHELPALARILGDLHREAHGDYFSAVRLFETRHQLPNCYNMKVDKASMAASVEARVPFLDVRVANEAFATPRELLLREGTNKHLLRLVAERHGLLPPEITRRPKYGASMAASWMEDLPGFRRFAREVVLDPGGWAGPLGLRPAMESYFDRGKRGYRFPHPLGIFSIVAWRLLLLNLWATRYLASLGRVPSAVGLEAHRSVAGETGRR